MEVVGLGVDYSDICLDYNTVYLDRDNKDPETTKCMRKVLKWSHDFIENLLATFNFNIYNLSSDVAVKIDDVSSKRFLFYSLEKDITLQGFVFAKAFNHYDGLSSWEANPNGSVLVHNDEDGGSLYFYIEKDSEIYVWIKEQLVTFSLDELPFPSK